MIRYDIRTFGATGDGSTLDTRAIQSAIDAAHEAGGGTVDCPPGVYRCGSMEMKSRVTLHLEAGCTLRASDRREDYLKIIPLEAHARRFNYDEHLLFARNAESVSITGPGTLDGSGTSFMAQDAKGSTVAGPWRPGPMVSFFECRDVLLRDIHLVNSPSWTLWLLGCERVAVDSITIDTPRTTPNGDGIDVCCCRQVRITNCDISSGDDCIAVLGLPYHLGHLNLCENVTVSNCTLTGPCSGVRVGYDSDSTVRNCTFSNLTMRAAIGMDVLSSQRTDWLTAAEKPTRHGPRVENILFANIVMEGRVLFHMHQDDTTKPPAGIRNIRYANITGTAEHACYFSGSRDIPLEDISLHHVRLLVNGEVTDQYLSEAPYPVSVWSSATKLPHGFYVRHARGVCLTDVQVKWGRVSGPWKSALRAEHVSAMNLVNVAACQAPGSEAPALHVSNAQGLSIRTSRAEKGAGTFLKLDGPQSRGNRVMDSDLACARKAFELGADMAADAFRQTGNLLPMV